MLEELGEGTLVMFTYETPDGTHVNIKLFDPSGAEIYSDTDKAKGSHGFTTEKEGDYKGKGGCLALNRAAKTLGASVGSVSYITSRFSFPSPRAVHASRRGSTGSGSLRASRR